MTSMCYYFIISLLYCYFHLGLAMNNKTEEFVRRFTKCTLLFHTKGANVKNKVLTVIYASLIPLIIVANLLLIFGIMKTRRNKLNSSQVLFLTLFVSDLTFGVVQIPSKIYLLWKTSEPTCFEIQLNSFSMTFPICMSGTLLCVISIDRYINIVHNRYYKRLVTKKSLTITIILVTLISFMWGTFDAQFTAESDTRKLAKMFIALSVYAGTVLGLGIIFNVALLRNVKRKARNSSMEQTIESDLTKTIALIVGLMVTAYLPAIIAINIAAYAFINSTAKQFIQKSSGNFLWILIPSQTNAVINSVIYFARNSPMKRYYCKLLNCGNHNRTFEKTVSHLSNSK